MKIDCLKLDMLLKERGMKPIDLAQKLGTEFFLGRGSSKRRLEMIADVLGVDVSELIAEESPIPKMVFTVKVKNTITDNELEELKRKLLEVAVILQPLPCEMILCKDCTFYDSGWKWCGCWEGMSEDDAYCCYAKRRQDERSNRQTVGNRKY